ncbi:MAG TPA: efflux RND transporter periplasmic adaptor subunit [Gemmataceae bacterium]|nr:efflux RND transporter periplasmic adaptor subunit [Gemmataceae bacterium]
MMPQPNAPPKQSLSPREKISLAIQLILSFAVAGGVFAFLVLRDHGPEDDAKRPSRPEEVVTLAGPRTLAIKAGTPLDDKLDKIAKVREATLTTPIVRVTGAAYVSLKPGKDKSTDTWQFASSELLTVFSDWRRAVADVDFQKQQLKLIEELNDKRVKRQEEVLARKEKLYKIGTETLESMEAERTNLMAFEIQKRKEIHEQQTQVTIAERTMATLARQLQQNGLEPTMLRAVASAGEIVVAEVPERQVRLVKVGMHCTVDFFALPDHKPFTGKVSAIAPVISKEKRVAAVQFVVEDKQKEIRPGMFARIGLGDKRDALVMPADGVLHVGDRDYVLVGDNADRWDIFQVETGELLSNDFETLPGDLIRGEIEILSGYSLAQPGRRLQKNDRVIGAGAILLQPMLIRALQRPEKVEKAGGGK